MKAKYIIVLRHSHIGDHHIEVKEDGDLETRFNQIIDNICDNPNSDATIVRVWNTKTHNWEKGYYFDRLHCIMNRDHSRYLDHKFDKEFPYMSNDAAVFPYD